MKRGLTTALAVALALGCGAVNTSDLMSVDTVAASGRSMRLDAGFFFGHDVRTFESVVYVLDLSGSMSGRTGTTLEQTGKGAAADVGGSMIDGVAGSDVGSAARSSVLDMDKKVELVKDHLNASLRGLPDGAEFNIVLFSGGVQTLSPTMITANTATTTVVSTFVSKLKEGGGTDMRAAIEAGLDTEAKDIMILTDGLPTDASPEAILAMVAEHNGDGSRKVFTVGVGADQAGDFLRQLAEDNGGDYQAYQ